MAHSRGDTALRRDNSPTRGSRLLRRLGTCALASALLVLNGSLLLSFTASPVSSAATLPGHAAAIAPRLATSLKTKVFDSATNAAWTGKEVTGSAAYDTATLSGEKGGIVPTGTVTYQMFWLADCQVYEESAPADTVTLVDGSVPASTSSGQLFAAAWSYEVSYSGNSTYAASTSCESFTVHRAPTSMASVVFDASTNSAWTGTETIGATAYDTSSISGILSSSYPPAGYVRYKFFTNGTCKGGATSIFYVGVGEQVGGPSSSLERPRSVYSVTQSPTVGPLAAGFYAFEASYTDYSGYYNNSASACEPFAVGADPTSVATTVEDGSTDSPWSGSEVTGASAYDTSAVSGETGDVKPTGTVTYSYFADGECSGTATLTDQVTLAGGNVPKSSTQGPLPAGSYSFDAAYSGNKRYAPSLSACEPFSVELAPSGVATTVFDASTGLAWSGTEATGASAYDTSAVSGEQGSIVPSGTVTYSYFDNGTCAGTAAETGIVTLTTTGTVPDSSTEGPLPEGSYSFQASYSGDTNYGPAASACEPFSVELAPSGVATTVFDASTGLAWSGT
ncbi:MAG: hypothetical protein ACRD0Z_02715, partial [Acidimicrobiales bacterium]